MGHEADDEISIDARSAWRDGIDVVICSRDKDLDMIPGQHYSWGTSAQKEKPMWFQDEIGGIRCFYKQLLTGDSVDNIPGLYGVGKSSALLEHIDEFDNELSMYEYCFEQYEKRFGSYAHQFMLENGRLLWLLTYPGELWNGPE
jgi:5'-3' exonuclease